MDTAQAQWKKYAQEELTRLTPIISNLGFTLDDYQPHILGERFLMQAVTTTSGRKLILLGKDADGVRVVIKATRDPNGIRELEHERTCRARLHEIRFAYQIFLTPEEVAYANIEGYVITAQKFIEQERPFLERPTPEQFTIALRAFKAQEGAHAATYEHIQRIRNTFGTFSVSDYQRLFESFIGGLLATTPSDTPRTLLAQASEQFIEGREVVNQYCGFLTHTDFVPHNFRVIGNDIYLLDHSSLRFGNKYEGWARFVNFMTLYNPELEAALVRYAADNRTPEESAALRLMRIYRLCEILWYYTRTLEQSDGPLLELNKARIGFWSDVLKAVLEKKTLDPEIRDRYIAQRDSLRSPEEKERQVGLH